MRQAFSHLSESCDTAGLYAGIGAEQWEKLKFRLIWIVNSLPTNKTGGWSMRTKLSLPSIPKHPGQFFQASIVKLPGA